MSKEPEFLAQYEAELAILDAHVSEEIVKTVSRLALKLPSNLMESLIKDAMIAKYQDKPFYVSGAEYTLTKKNLYPDTRSKFFNDAAWKKIAEHSKRYRAENQITQAALAIQLETSASMICSIENNSSRSTPVGEKILALELPETAKQPIVDAREAPPAYRGPGRPSPPADI